MSERAAKRIHDHRASVEVCDVVRITCKSPREQTGSEGCAGRKPDNRRMEFSVIQRHLPQRSSSKSGLYNAARSPCPLCLCDLYVNSLFCLSCGPFSFVKSSPGYGKPN